MLTNHRRAFWYSLVLLGSLILVLVAVGKHPAARPRLALLAVPSPVAPRRSVPPHVGCVRAAAHLFEGMVPPRQTARNARGDYRLLVPLGSRDRGSCDRRCAGAGADVAGC